MMPVDWGWRTNRWRRLISRHFNPEDADSALGVIYYESRGKRRAWNRTSDARGLFQHLHRHWPWRSRQAGWAGWSEWSPGANAAVAAWLVYEHGGWKHWPNTYPLAVEAVRRGHL
jgi:hypothetical protein